MRIAITGHTRGIGKSITDLLIREGHELLGLSRSCGTDIKDTSLIVGLVEPYDVFINNAHDGFAQVMLLDALYRAWKDQPKLIICMGSNSPDCSPTWDNTYSTEKSALDSAARRLGLSNNQCRVTNLRPGYVDTARVSSVNKPKLNTDEVAKIVSFLIGLPDGVFIREITVEAK